jgi:hypothetical protein
MDYESEKKPNMGARSLYAKSLGKHLKTKESYKNEANEKAYGDVEKKHGKEVTRALKDWHHKNATDNGDFDAFASLKKANGGKIDLKNCKINTAQTGKKHKINF